jgi:DNA polymerase (family 10)
MRLDMDWRHWRKAADRGLLSAINPDAHETSSLADVRGGVNVARKGGLRPEQVLTTWPLARLEKWMRERREKK